MNLTAPSLTISFVQGTRKGTQCALWLPGLAVLFVTGPPLAMMHGRTLYLRANISTAHVRRVAQWLADNHYPPMSEGITFQPAEFSNEVLSHLAAVSATLHQRPSHAL